MPLVCGLFNLSAAVVDVLHRQVELILVTFGCAAVLRATIDQHSLQGHPVFIEERDHPVIEQVGRHQRGLALIELGEGQLGVGINEGLLINPAPLL